MAETSALQPSLLVFADDWGRHPSSCQHLISRLLPRRSTLWVNTIGTRRPSFDLVTLRRGLEKAWHWTRNAAPALPKGLRVVSPRMWPTFGSRYSRALNRRLLDRQLTPLLAGSPRVAITTLPIVADLVGRLPVDRWVYYCVDDFSEWPGLDGATLRDMESDLVGKVDVLIAASQHLADRLAGLGRSATLLTHGVDLDHWREPSTPQPDWLANLPRPLIIFWGLIDRRLDLDVVTRLADSLSRGTLLLVGPQQNPDPRLAGLNRVHLAPAVPYTQLPVIARESAVLVMPYADLPVTQAMQPLKLKEYLATGKPVVATELPATREWRDCLDLAADAGQFVDRVQQRLADGLPAPQRHARERLLHESWSAKAARFESIIAEAADGTVAPRRNGSVHRCADAASVSIAAAAPTPNSRGANR
jgi:glycosyltransferase involved in cell wall biosynthesis